MRRASPRRSATAATSRNGARRERKSLRSKVSNRPPAVLVSKSSNAFWNRSARSSSRVKSKGSQRNNSTASEYPSTNASGARKFQTLRKAIVQRLRGNSKKKKSTINARSVLYHRSKPRRVSSTDMLNTPNVDRHRTSSESPSLLSPERMEQDEDDGLAPSTSLFKRDYQNINATHNLSRSVRQVSQTMVNPSAAKSNRTRAKRGEPPRTTWECEPLKSHDKNNLSPRDLHW